MVKCKVIRNVVIVGLIMLLIPFTRQQEDSCLGKQDYGFVLPSEFFNECGTEHKGDPVLDDKVFENPWLAMLILSKPAELIAIVGGGTLIASRYVLAAAHCVMKNNTTNPELRQVHLGQWPNKGNAYSMYVKIQKIHLHDDFRVHDIAMLRLDEEVQFNDYIYPICLPPTFTSDLENAHDDGHELESVGWGISWGDQSEATVPKIKVPLAVVNIDRCNYVVQTVFRQTKKVNGTYQICAGLRDGRSACKGDSGNLLLARSITGRSLAIGIASYGAQICSQKGIPIVYTKIRPYMDWILGLIAIDKNGV